MADINDPRIDALAPLTDRVRTDITAIKDATGAQAWTREPLTPERMARHLNGGPARGVCPIKEGESVTLVGLLDLDSHGGETPWAEMARIGAQVVETLELMGGSPVAFKSSGGRGIHIYCLWDDPQDAYSVREWLRAGLAGCGLRAGVKGVSRGEVEVFPKQDRVPVGGYGSQFILPLAGASVPLEVCELAGVLVERVGGRAAVPGMAWGVCESVPVRVRPERGGGEVAAGGGVGADLLSALAVLNVPGVGGAGELDYDEWRNVVFALHHETGGSDEGLALAHEVSARSGKYDPAFLDERVWPYITSDRGSAVTGRTVLAMARARGWDGDGQLAGFIDTFDVVPVTGGSGGAGGGDLPPPAFTRDRGGAILPTATNAVLAVRRPDLLGWRVAHDDFKDEVMIAAEGAGGGRAGGTGPGWRAMRDADMVGVRMELERLGFKTVPKELARDAVVKVCAENAIDSAQLWLTGLERGAGSAWDGVARVDRFLVDYFGCADTEYVRACGRYLWTALAGRVLDPGCQVDMIVTLAGGQGLRKTSAIGAMVPGAEFAIEVDFGQKEEDTARRMRGALVGEVAELRGLRSKDSDAIKKFITRRWEQWVPKYKEFSTTFPRRLVFVGTVNPDSLGFLGDETGERRWLPVEVSRADVAGIASAREQLWVEGAALWRAGGVAWQDAERLAAPMHEKYAMSDMWEDRVCGWLDGVDELGEGVANDSGQKIASRGEAPRGFSLDDLASGLGLSFSTQSMLTQKRLGAILRKLGYEKRQMWDGKRKPWRWVLMSPIPGDC